MIPIEKKPVLVCGGYASTRGDAPEGSNLIERPFELDQAIVEPDDEQLLDETSSEGRTREYNAEELISRAERPGTIRPKRHTSGFHAVGALSGLDVFIKETSTMLATAGDELSDTQRAHLSKILTFVQALSDRYERVMRMSSR